jgi:hypothetical protein
MIAEEATNTRTTSKAMINTLIGRMTRPLSHVYVTW